MNDFFSFFNMADICCDDVISYISVFYFSDTEHVELDEVAAETEV
jgi:hypothetical protein